MVNKVVFSYLSGLIVIGIMLSGCLTDSNDEGGLNLKGTFNSEVIKDEVYTLKERLGWLFMGAETGLFVKPNQENSWDNLINEEVSVRAVEQISENRIIASLYYNDRDSAVIGMTTNFGENWNNYRNGFDPISNSIPTIITKISDEIYSGGSILRVAKSTDAAQSWEIVLGSWEGFGSLFFINSVSESIWAGGSTASFAPLVYSSNDNGKTWCEIPVLENIEAVAYDLINLNNNLLIGLSGGVSAANIIRRSQDNGETWETVFQGAGIFTFTKSAHNPEIVYASGRNSTGTLFFLASEDFGDTWQTIEFEDSPGEIYVNDMVSVMDEGNEVLYLGTNKGLYSYMLED